MKKHMIAAITAGLMINISTMTYADSPRPGHNNAEMFQQIDKNGDTMQADAAALNKMAPAAGGNKANWKACKSEIAASCHDIKGDEKIAKCLQHHHASASAACNDTTKQYEDSLRSKQH